MKRILLGALTAVALSASPLALTAAVAAGDQSAETTRADRAPGKVLRGRLGV